MRVSAPPGAGSPVRDDVHNPLDSRFRGNDGGHVRRPPPLANPAALFGAFV